MRLLREPCGGCGACGAWAAAAPACCEGGASLQSSLPPVCCGCGGAGRAGCCWRRAAAGGRACPGGAGRTAAGAGPGCWSAGCCGADGSSGAAPRAGSPATAGSSGTRTDRAPRTGAGGGRGAGCTGSPAAGSPPTGCGAARRGVRGRRVGQEVPPALLAERRAALTRAYGTAGRAPALGGTADRSPGPGWPPGRRGRREAVAAAAGAAGRRRRHGTGHAVTADLAPVVGTRLVSVRAGRHVGASPSPLRPDGRFAWCFCGHRAGYFFTRTVFVDRVSRVISSASATFAFSRTVPVAASTTSTTFASSFAVSAFPEALAS